MTFDEAIDAVLTALDATRKPLAVVVAGHNGSGKSTLWRDKLSARFRIPLINADRMMLSILPEPDPRLPSWAQSLRDTDERWMRVAQLGVEAFTTHAMNNGLPFAFETVFSHWQPQAGGKPKSKIEKIERLQDAGYFVLLVFVGLISAELSIARVASRVAAGGHDVPQSKLRDRFGRTQAAIAAAREVADATLMYDNSGDETQAFTLAFAGLGKKTIFDVRGHRLVTAGLWLDKIVPI